jgi:Tetratricopeptide repeat
MRLPVVLAIVTALLVPVAAAQRPPAPTPTPTPSPSPSPPSSTPTNLPATFPPSNTDLSQPGEERVMFLRGRVATNDGTPIPNDAVVERVCNNNVRQQVFASSHGDFSMELGSRADSILDASGDPSSPSLASSMDSTFGLTRRELMNCELRATAGGFRSPDISLVDLDVMGGAVDVGMIVLQRFAKVDGMTLDASAYKAPKNARKAYEKGLQAERKANFESARENFEKAVQIYPEFATAWFQLGAVLQNQKQRDAARKAYTKATALDETFLPPFLSLASLAFEDANWPTVLTLTNHILERDPLNHIAAGGYAVDLDSYSCSEAYYYNAVANYMLNKFAAAEKIGLKAEHVDLITRFPQLHLMMGELFARKNDYVSAIAELQIYLALLPHAVNTIQVRQRLAELEKLNASASTADKPDHE